MRANDGDCVLALRNVSWGSDYVVKVWKLPRAGQDIYWKSLKPVLFSPPGLGPTRPPNPQVGLGLPWWNWAWQRPTEAWNDARIAELLNGMQKDLATLKVKQDALVFYKWEVKGVWPKWAKVIENENRSPV